MSKVCSTDISIVFCVSRLTFVFNPSSKVYNYTFVELKPNGENEVRIVTLLYSH